MLKAAEVSIRNYILKHSSLDECFFFAKSYDQILQFEWSEYCLYFIDRKLRVW